LSEKSLAIVANADSWKQREWNIRAAASRRSDARLGRVQAATGTWSAMVDRLVLLPKLHFVGRRTFWMRLTRAYFDVSLTALKVGSDLKATLLTSSV
jgi:hypothetical protein